MLLHVVDGAAGNVVRAWRAVREELSLYGGGLADKPEIVVLNKCDAMSARETSSRRAALSRATGQDVMSISGVSGQGVPEMLRRLADGIRGHRQDRTAS